MNSKLNQYSYKTASGISVGFFNLWQSKKGAIFLEMGGGYTELSYDQLKDLNINVYDIIDFEDGAYEKYYGV